MVRSAGPGRRGVLAGALAAVAAPSAAFAQAQTPSLAGKGVSHALALERAASLAEVRYDLRLDLTGLQSAAGAVGVGFVRRRAGAGLIVDFRGASLTAVRANGVPVGPLQWRDGHLFIPERCLRLGSNRLTARFTTPIAAAGAAIIGFDDASDGARYLYTLLVPSDANLLFPCFDQPDLKARLRWTLRAPAHWSVLANTAPVRITPDQGARVWRFAQSEPIPTYLAAFAAGPWARRVSAPAGAAPIALYARASRMAEADAEAIIAANRDAARWLADWFATPFPFSKLDALLAPAFPFGGMEHVGAIFYNEESFIFREPPTLTERLDRDATVYHEVSHQWFGDLVTMRWFDDLWLKEGFATYMAARVQAALQPQSEAWKGFFLRYKGAAYATDATRGTTPVWQALDNLDQAKGAYGPIVYNKAPAILKQLAFLAGEDAFRRGLNGFLARHAYANAGWRDLLAAVEAAGGPSLTAFGEQFILRAGMPRIDTHLALEGGRIAGLTLSQRPVRDLPGDPGGHWPMKVQVRLGYADRPDVVLAARFEAERAVVAGAEGLPAPSYVWANDDDQGYGLFLPDAASAAWLEDHVGDIKDGLLRAMLWGALWDLVRERVLAPARFAGIALGQLGGEADEEIARQVVRHATTALDRYLAGADAARLIPQWEALMARRAADGALPYGQRKDSLEALIDIARTPSARAVLRAYLAGDHLFDGAPVRQVTRWRIVQRLLALGEADGEALLAAERRHDLTPQVGRSAFVAAAAIPQALAKRAWFARALDDPALNEEWVTASLTAFNDPGQTTLTAPFLAPALARLRWIRDHRRIFFLPAWIDAFVGGQQSAEALSSVDQVLTVEADLPIDIRRKLLEARDKLERTVLIRAFAAGG